MSLRYLIVYPEERWATVEEIIEWAKDDIRNGNSTLCEHASEVQNLDDALAVLADSGTVTVSPRTEEDRP